MEFMSSIPFLSKSHYYLIRCQINTLNFELSLETFKRKFSKHWLIRDLSLYGWVHLFKAEGISRNVQYMLYCLFTAH